MVFEPGDVMLVAWMHESLDNSKGVESTFTVQ